MSALTNTIGWVITLAVINWLTWKTVGLTPVWGVACQVGQSLGWYVQVTNVCLALGIVAGGIWWGTRAAIKFAAALLLFNLVPGFAAALFSFGRGC